MKEKIWILVISAAAFLVGIGITAYVLTSGPGGQAKLELAGNKFEIQINEVDFEKLFNNPKHQETAKMSAKKILRLYEIDEELIKELESISYDTAFSKSLRDMRDRFKGPFNAPDKKIVLSFSDSIDSNRAEVCPDSDFYNNRINIALADFTHMYPIENAGIARAFGCPPAANKPEEIVISKTVGQRLLGVKNLPPSIQAVAKGLPSYVIIPK